MKFLIAILCMLLVAATATSVTDREYQFLFSKYIKEHQKSYKVDEFFNRFEIFKANLDLIRAHNNSGKSSSMAMNQFGDLTSEEFKTLYTGYKKIDRSFSRAQNSEQLTVSALPTAVDWRSKNAVTPVKNQQQCGSCWAFSTTGSVEGITAIKTGKLVSLSEQQLVDCSASAGNNGCSGGLMDYAFQWIISNGGICSENSYPYTAEDGTCKTTCTPVAKITGYKDVASMDENALQAAVAQQPVSVAIEADQAVFQFYSGGVLDDASCGTQLDHGVLVVGYGASSEPYWIVKNSWGADWGMSGYVLIARNKNMCGIATEPSYPTA